MSPVDDAPAPPGRWPLPALATMPGAGVFVWGVWAVMLLLALGYVVKFSSRHPVFDDWDLVPVLTGAEPFTPAYLWAPYNEHRVPLPKLVLYALGRLSGFDFRAGMVLNVLLLAGLSFAMLRAVGRLRGGRHFADAFLPLVVLSLAQWECFLVEYNLNLVGATVCAGAFLVCLAGADPRALPRPAVRMAACLVLLPLFGASGLVLVPAPAVWLAVVGLRHARTGDSAVRRQGQLVLALVTAAVLLCGLYFVGLPPAAPGPHATPAYVLTRAYQLLGMLVGAGDLPGATLKPVVVPLALLAAGAIWLTTWLRQPGERVLLLGWLSFVVAMGGLVVAVAYGRSDYLGQTAFVPRYVTLFLPLSCGLYFLWARYGGAVALPARPALFLLAAVMFVPDLQSAVDGGRYRRRAVRTFEADLADRVPPAVLAERGAGRMFPAEQLEAVTRCIHYLRDCRATGYRELPADQPLTAVAVHADAVALSDMTAADGTTRPTGDDPALAVVLPRPGFVSVVRLHYAYTNSAGTEDFFDVSWLPVGEAPTRTGRAKVLLEGTPAGGERTITIWVNDRIAGFRMVPRIKVFALRLAAVEVLIPESTDVLPGQEVAGR